MHTRYTHMSGDAHTHARRWDDGGRCSLPYPILASSPRDSQEQWAASDAAPGDQVQVLGPVLVRDRTDEHLLFLLGFYGGNPGEHGENMQTPHRKAREQAPTCCTMRDLNPRPSCCEATVLCTVPPVPPRCTFLKGAGSLGLTRQQPPRTATLFF